MTTLPAKSESRNIQRRHTRNYKSGKEVTINPNKKGKKATPAAKRTTESRAQRRGPTATSRSRPVSSPILPLLPKKDQAAYELYRDNLPQTILWFDLNQPLLGMGNVAMQSCPVCGKPTGEILVAQKSMPGTPVSMQMCEECFKKHKNHVLVVEVDKEKGPTGRTILMHKKFFEGDPNASNILRMRTVYMTPKDFQGFLQAEVDRIKASGEKMPEPEPADIPIDISELEKDLKEMTRLAEETRKELEELNKRMQSDEKISIQEIDKIMKRISERDKKASDKLGIRIK